MSDHHHFLVGVGTDRAGDVPARARVGRHHDLDSCASAPLGVLDEPVTCLGADADPRNGRLAGDRSLEVGRCDLFGRPVAGVDQPPPRRRTASTGVHSPRTDDRGRPHGRQ
ncbi:hypothetical protein C490_09463 [Natronobacterium gregoryi SP2]|uniref:Uncharacterized protein n=1 Tax=Natronobacterium gregoryi (strain ATCC 43098 / DSM 3393 / CCM 3738 / CIP 104747 / IAM 13177 / JCM 8860 / NBRC 102187 / NCIMB 2189 / SP2) TaxID=797304 RepID=L9Y4P2_NATGS|nr:hypothetical protein C490_09463 [Natronobacterium gregoryi SP2]